MPDTYDKSKPAWNRGLWGHLSLACYEPLSSQSWGVARSLSLGNDASGWEFQEIGAPWTFEETGRYEKFPVKNRLDVHLLEDYLREFGILVSDPHFYDGKATIVSVRSPLLGKVKTYDAAVLRQQMLLEE